jgi:hypothetical protein
MDPRKEAICNALAAFIRQRPGFEYGNYGDAASYRADVRAVGKDKAQAETLLAAVRWRDGITADDMLKDRGGRLAVKEKPAGRTISGVFIASPVPDAPPVVEVTWCAGQYYCTEYRAGVARYLASLLWDYTRDKCMPAAIVRDGEKFYPHAPGDKNGVAGGTWLRAHFRKEFGSAIQRRWFN